MDTSAVVTVRCDGHQRGNAMISSGRIKQLEDAIIHHLNTVGSQDWAEVKKDFLEIPNSSFWRHVKRIKAQLESRGTPPVPADLFSSREQTSSQAKPQEKLDLNSAFRMLQHAQRYHELSVDIEALRQHALDANGNIRDAKLFAKTIVLRNQVLNDELSVVDTVNSTEFKIMFVQKIYDTVSNIDPAIANEIILALQKVSKGSNEFE
jgi:hypothetical protein